MKASSESGEWATRISMAARSAGVGEGAVPEIVENRLVLEILPATGFELGLVGGAETGIGPVQRRLVVLLLGHLALDHEAEQVLRIPGEDGIGQGRRLGQLADDEVDH